VSSNQSDYKLLSSLEELKDEIDTSETNQNKNNNYNNNNNRRCKIEIKTEIPSTTIKVSTNR
jgi:hypothetical protein